MASYAFTDAYLYGGYGATEGANAADFGPYARSLSLEMTVETLDNTTFQSTARSRIGGLTDVAMSGEFIADDTNMALLDTHLPFANSSAGVVQPVALLPDGTTAGTTAFGFKSLHTSYGQGGQVGDLMVVPFSAVGSSRAFRGISLGSVTDTASGTSTAVQHVATAGDDTDKLYATLHVTAMTATSLAVKIQSDTSAGMSSPTDRITFATVSDAKEAEFAQEASDPTGGADDYFRVNYTVTGAGSVTFLVTLGIRST